MHPQIIQDKPGQCPICGMNLIKIKEDEKQMNHDSTDDSSIPVEHRDIMLSDMRQQLIGVKTGIVEKKQLIKNIRTSGRLAYDPELYTVQNEYIEAINHYKQLKNSSLADVRQSAERMVKSARLRLKILGLSDKQIESLSENVDGNGRALLLNKAGEDVWVYADIYEMDIPYVHEGLSAEITANFLGGTKISGKIVAVDSVLNPQTRTAKARILLPKTKTLLRPESYVDVTINVPLGEQLTIPFDAVFDTGTQTWTFVTDGMGHFEPRLIMVSFNANDSVAISSGLKEGEKIVTSANFLVDSESRIKWVQMQGANSNQHEHMGH
ncbi:MAG: efflux RND transporter periplasmic adaptor subunit [Bdellovibrio sp.]|nr:efflux RND transporter periplasmic adaptor subunit [Bdellovibrio sp.]